MAGQPRTALVGAEQLSAQARLKRVRFASERGFAVLACADADGAEFVAVGQRAALAKGDRVLLEGAWQGSKYGRPAGVVKRVARDGQAALHG